MDPFWLRLPNQSHRPLKRSNFNEEKVLATDLVFNSQFYLKSSLGKWPERFMKFEEFEAPYVGTKTKLSCL